MDVVINGVKDELPVDGKPLSGQGDYYQNLLLCLGHQPQSLPLADLLKHYHHLEGKWLIASPIHWEATHNDAMVVAAGKNLGLSDEESVFWFDQVAGFLKADGFNPIFHDAQAWLFNIDNKPAINSLAVQSILHKSLMPILNSLDESLYWQRLITELQMYMAAQALNSAVNGLWFWGEGDFDLKTERPITTDDEVLIDYALSRGKSIGILNSKTAFDSNHLLIIKDPKQLASPQLEEKINKKKANWYWNNCSYSRQASHWWSRIWR